MAIYFGGSLVGVAGSQPRNESDIIPFKLGQITSLSKKDMEGLTEIEPYMFYWEWKLNHIDIPETVTKIGNNAFYCTSIENLIIPESVTSIASSSFDYMINLKTLDLSKCNVSTSLNFNNCPSLENLILNNKSSINMVSNFTSLIKVIIPEDHPNYFVKDNCWIANKSLTNRILLKALNNASIPDDENITTINSYAFYNIAVKNLTIPNSVTSLKSYAFNWIKDLSILNIPSTINSYDLACLYALEDLKELNIEGTSTAINSGSFGYYFQNIPNLEKLYLNKSFNGSGSYSSCNAGFGGNTKEGVSISFGENLTSTPYAFLYWTNTTNDSNTINFIRNTFGSTKGSLTSKTVKSLIIPRTKIKDITNWGNINTVNNYSFYYCDYKNIVIPNNITKINQSAYQNVYNTENVYYDANVTNITSYSNRILCSSYMSSDAIFTFGPNVTSIPSYLLGTSSNSNSYKTYFKSIKFTQGSQVTELPTYFTAYNTTLTDCIIPHSVTTISSNAFTGCTKLNTIYYEGTEEEYNNITNNDTSTYLANAEKVYYNNHIHNGYVANEDGTITETKGWRWDINGKQDFVGNVGEWIIDKPAYTCSEGSKYTNCNICGARIEEVIPIISMWKEYKIIPFTSWGKTHYWYLEDINIIKFHYNNNVVFPSGSEAKFNLKISKQGIFSFNYSNYWSGHDDWVLTLYKNNIKITRLSGQSTISEVSYYEINVEEDDTITFGLIKNTSNNWGGGANWGVIINILPEKHTCTTWITMTEPTCTIEGSEYSICDVCSERVERSIPKIHHNMVNGICTMCGLSKTTEIDLTIDPTYPWVYDETLECYKSGNKNKSNSSSSFAVNIIGDGTLYYDWAQSSEINYDYLTVYKNNIKVIDYKGKGTSSSSFTYTTASLEVNNGDIIKFTYSKDSSSDSGSDEARIKNIRIE